MTTPVLTPAEVAAAQAAALAAKKVADDAVAAAKAAEAEEEEDEALEDEIPEFLASASAEVKKAYIAHNKGLLSALHKERDFHKKHKDAAKKVTAFEAAEATRKTAEMSDAEKLKVAKETAEGETLQLKKDLQTERIKSTVLAVAAKMTFADPQDAYTFIDPDELEIDDKGVVDVPSVEEALKALLKAKPYLAGESEPGRFNLNAGDKGRLLKGATQEEIIKKKRARYHPL